MRGGFRKGAGRPVKSENEKVKYTVKTVKFKKEEKYILDYIQEYNGQSFSEKLKNILKEIIEKK